MKILYHHRIASRDGRYVHIEELVNALQRRSHEILVVGPGNVQGVAFGADSGLVARLKRLLPGALYDLMEFGYSLLASLRLVQAIREFRPDCIYQRYNRYLLSGIWASRLFGLPLLREVNAPLFAERMKYSRIALPALARWTETRAWLGADAVLPVTGVLAEIVATARVDRGRIHVVPNGINVERFQGGLSGDALRSKLGLENGVVLGFTGFVREWRRLDRVDDLLRTADGERPRHLLLVGDGPARQQIEDRAVELGIRDRVTITGMILRDTVPVYVVCLDIALQPGAVEYASPLKLFEYLALGRPVVAPDTPNIREVLSDGDDALLFEPRDDAGFLGVVERLCNDPGLRQGIGTRAGDTIMERCFTWANNTRRVTELFERLLAAGRPGRAHG